MSDKLTSGEDLGNVKLTVDDQAKLEGKHRPNTPIKGLGNVNLGVDHQAKLKDKPGFSQSAEWSERQYQEDLALFTGSFRDQIIEMDVDADALHKALSSYSYSNHLWRQLISHSSITSAELEMFLLNNEIITGMRLMNIKANAGSQQEAKRKLLRETLLSGITPRRMIHMAQSHENRSIYESLCSSFIDHLREKMDLEWRYQKDLTLFTGSFRDQIIELDVDAAVLDGALSSRSCLRAMSSILIILSSITSTELEMFLLKNHLISEPTFEDIKAKTDSQQEIKDRLLRRMLPRSSLRKLIHMAQSHENRSIYESLCSGFIDYLRYEQADSDCSAGTYPYMVGFSSGIPSPITDRNFGFENVNLTVGDPTMSQPKPSSSKTRFYRRFMRFPAVRETTLGKVNASLDHRAKLEGKPGPSQPRRAKNIPSETKSIKIGKDGDEIEVGGSFVRFEPGTFNDVETITISARLDPDEWPPGREAVTSTLDICAKNLQKMATLRLHTWLVADNEYTDVDIMCYKKLIKKWELFTTSSVGDSGFIEFQSQHFSKWIALLRNPSSKTYRMRPIVSFKSRDFVLALVRDAPLKIEQLLKDLTDDYGHDLTTRKLKPITCKKVNKVECFIEAIPDHFKFIDSAACTHDIKSIIEDHVMSYLTCQLKCNSDCPATSSQEMVPETIRISLKVDGNELRTPDCFSYEQPQPDNKESSKDKNKEDKVIQKVGGDVHFGINVKMNDNSKRDFSGAAIDTVNDGTLTNTAENCTTSINAQKK